MGHQDQLADQFEADRARLRAMAYRMLGSLAEADDAVQEAWLRLTRPDAAAVRNLSGWLTTVVARICLDMLRARRARPEQPLGVHLPDPVVTGPDGSGPEEQALLADSVGLALLIVLDTLTPPERLAFVLHDMFGLPFTQIAALLDRSPNAAKLLASRARQRVRGAAASPGASLDHQREIVDAFFAASRDGDFDALVGLLDPAVVVRADYGATPAGASREIRGAGNVAAQAARFSQLYPFVKPAMVNGTAGAIIARPGRPLAVMSFTVSGRKISEINILADRRRLRQLHLTRYGSVKPSETARDALKPTGSRGVHRRSSPDG